MPKGLLREVDMNLGILHLDGLEEHKRDIYKWLKVTCTHPNIRKKVRAKLISILRDVARTHRQKHTMAKLLHQFELYKRDEPKNVADYKVDIDLDEIARFKIKELMELKAQLPRSAFDYIRDINKGLKISNKNKDFTKEPSGLHFDAKEIDRRIG